MNKVRVNKIKGEDKIIGIGNASIYKVNPPKDKVFQYANDIENNRIPDDVLSIPYSYIKKIHYQECKKYIQVFFGQESEEYLHIINANNRNELLKSCKELIPHADYQYEEYSAFKSGKAPLIALLISTVLFLWTLNYAIQIEAGYDYQLAGSYRSIVAIVLGLASLGVAKVVMIFVPLITLSFISMWRKMKNKPVVHKIVINRPS